MLRYRIRKKLDRMLGRTIARCYICGRRLSETERRYYENTCERCESAEITMYESNKSGRYAMIAALILYAAFCTIWLHRAEAICNMQRDVLNQITDIRQEVYASAEPEPVVDVKTTAGLTAAGYDRICRIVAAEARGEGYEGQLAVAQVIRDRAHLWGMTPLEVITAPGQFTRPYQGEITAETQAAVDAAFEGESAFDGPVTHFAEISTTPYWAKDKEIVGVIGSHRFYR